MMATDLAVVDHSAVRSRLGIPLTPRPRMRLDLIGRRKVLIQAQPEAPVAPVVLIETVPAPDFAPFDFFQPPTMKAIIRLVSLKHGVPIADMLGSTRVRAPTLARQEAMALIYTHMERSTTEIGRYFGNRDHTTVIHALRKAGMKGRRPC